MSATEAASQAIITEAASQASQANQTSSWWWSSWWWEHRQMLAAAGGSTDRSVLLRLSLQQLRQIEQATSHQEGRQDSCTGLLSDQDRHIEQFMAEMASARQRRDEGGQAVIQSRYRTARRDWIHRAASHSCFSFCEAWWRLPRKL